VPTHHHLQPLTQFGDGFVHAPLKLRLSPGSASPATFCGSSAATP
jgi:hypothetical protein